MINYNDTIIFSYYIAYILLSIVQWLLKFITIYIQPQEDCNHN